MGTREGECGGRLVEGRVGRYKGCKRFGRKKGGGGWDKMRR